MARRTWTQLLAGLADNTSGSITAEDVRSVVDSVRPNVTSSAPTTGDDSSAGYDVGSGWLDTSEPALYECRDASVGAAVWVKVWPQSGGGGGGATDFTDLGDAPSSYSGHGGKVVAVKSGEDGLEFISASGGGGGDLTVEQHGSNASAARPLAAIVLWRGSSTPTNALNGDMWDDSEDWD